MCVDRLKDQAVNHLHTTTYRVLLVTEFALTVGMVLPLEGTFMGGLDAVFANGVAVGLQARANIFVVLDKVDAVEVWRHLG